MLLNGRIFDGKGNLVITMAINVSEHRAVASFGEKYYIFRQTSLPSIGANDRLATALMKMLYLPEVLELEGTVCVRISLLPFIRRIVDYSYQVLSARCNGELCAGNSQVSRRCCCINQ